jgi:hypothetical protein
VPAEPAVVGLRVRLTTAFNRILQLPGASVRTVAFTDQGIVIGLHRRRRRLLCPCGATSRARYDSSRRRWRHLDFGACQVWLEADIHRIDCRGCVYAISTWVSKFDDLRSIPSSVVRSMRGSGVVLDSQLLEFAAAAEGLHRRVMDKRRTASYTRQEAKAVRKSARQAAGDNELLEEAVLKALGHLSDISYPERLGELLGRAREAMHSIDEWDCAEWKARVVEIRNGLAHRVPADHRPPWKDPWREEVAVMNSLRWLLTVVLLLESGIPPSVVAGRLDRHQRYQTFLEQAREWLPAVFRRPTQEEKEPERE